MIDIPDVFPEYYFDDMIRPSNVGFDDALDREDDEFYFC